MKNGFIFYDSFYKALSRLKPEEQKKCLKVLCEYALEGIEPDENEDTNTLMFFELIKPQIDKNNQRYENGCKGGRPKNQTKPNETKQNQTITKIEKAEPKDKDKVKDKDKDKVKDKDSKEEKKEESEVALVKATPTPQAEVFEYFANLYKQETNIDYLGKAIDYINLAKLIKKYGKALVIQKINWLLVGCKNSVFFFSKDMTDFNISTLTAQWDRILPKLTDEQRKEEAKRKKEEETKAKVLSTLAKQGIKLEGGGNNVSRV